MSFSKSPLPPPKRTRHAYPIAPRLTPQGFRLCRHTLGAQHRLVDGTLLGSGRQAELRPASDSSHPGRTLDVRRDGEIPMFRGFGTKQFVYDLFLNVNGCRQGRSPDPKGWLTL